MGGKFVVPFVADNQKSGFSKTGSSSKNGWMPQVGGVVGQLLGGLGGTLLGGGAGTAVEPGGGTVLGGIGGERIGQTLGGAVGQGGGEWLQELLSGQKPQVGNIANQAGQGALWAQVPGGKMAEGIGSPVLKLLAKAGIRGIGGAAIGGGTQAMQNVQQGNPLTQGVLGSGATTGAINAVTGGVGDFGGQLVKDIANTTNLPVISKMQELYRNAVSSAVGHYNADYAINEGIVPQFEKVVSGAKTEGFLGKQAIDTMISNRLNKAKQVESALQEKLSGYKLDQQTSTLLKNELKGIIGDKSQATNPALWVKISNIIKTTPINDLSGLNGLKRAVGEFYNADEPNVANVLYNHLKDYIEQSAAGGASADAVKTLNQEAAQLVDMRYKLNKLKFQTTLPAGQTPADISKALENAKTVPTGGKTPPALTALQGIAQILGGTGFGIAGAGLGSALGGAGAAGGGIGAAFAGRRLGQKFIENPDVLNSIASLLKSKGMNITSQGLQQLLLRGGAAAGGNTQ